MTQRRPRGDAQPFDQRFLLFMLASVAILMLFSRAAPPPVEKAKPADQAEIAEAQQAEDIQVAKAPSDEFAPDAQEEATPSLTQEEEELTTEPLLATLGNANSEGAYRLLMTLDNVGAGVRRIELSSDSYRDLENRAGYLGRLALSDAPQGGALIRVVGPGTPAAEIGLAPGDVINSVRLGATLARSAGEVIDIAEAEDLSELLKSSRPGQSIDLTAQREGKELSFSTKLRRQPLNLIRPEAENVALHSPKISDDYESVDSFLVRLVRVGGRDAKHPDLIEANRRLTEEAWVVEQPDDETALFRMKLNNLGIEIVKQFTISEVPDEERENKAYPGYHFDLQVEVRNLSGEQRRVAYELTGPNGLPIEGYWYATKVGRGWGGYGLRDVVVRYVNSRFEQFAASSVHGGDVDPMGQGQPLAFVGVDAQYFASVIIPQKRSLADVKLETVRADLATSALSDNGKALVTWENASCVLERKAIQLPPNASVADEYRIFAGPKLPALLKEYRVNDDAGHALDNLLYYGWFGPVARIMLGILHLFNSLVGNYGLAIVMLTIVVRGALFPLSRQQAKNMLMMQQLKPEMDRIAQKYKDDMQKRSQAQQELFRKHNYNPAAGCLPIFLQLPIFLGLYRALSVDVELRQAPLFTDSIRFCSNLAAPDMFYDWSWLMPHWVDTGQGIMGLGPYFNLLPIATIVLFIVQQKMFMPPATDDQTRLQQKMMQYMMIFMGLLFFKVPSGLCIYFIASSLWGVAERKMLPKAKPPESTAEAEKPELPATPKPTGAGSANARRRPKSKKRKR